MKGPVTGDVFSGVISPDDLFSRLRKVCSAQERLKGAHLTCSSRYPESILCLIDAENGQAAALACEIGGQVFGFHTVMLNVPITGDFQCAQRSAGKSVTWDCALCRN